MVYPFLIFSPPDAAQMLSFTALPSHILKGSYCGCLSSTTCTNITEHTQALEQNKTKKSFPFPANVEEKDADPFGIPLRLLSSNNHKRVNAHQK